MTGSLRMRGDRGSGEGGGEGSGRVEGAYLAAAFFHRGEGMQQDDEHVVSLLLALHHYRDVTLKKGIFKTLEMG